MKKTNLLSWFVGVCLLSIFLARSVFAEDSTAATPAAPVVSAAESAPVPALVTPEVKTEQPAATPALVAAPAAIAGLEEAHNLVEMGKLKEARDVYRTFLTREGL